MWKVSPVAALQCCLQCMRDVQHFSYCENSVSAYANQFLLTFISSKCTTPASSEKITYLKKSTSMQDTNKAGTNGGCLLPRNSVRTSLRVLSVLSPPPLLRINHYVTRLAFAPDPRSFWRCPLINAGPVPFVAKPPPHRFGKRGIRCTRHDETAVKENRDGGCSALTALQVNDDRRSVYGGNMKWKCFGWEIHWNRAWSILSSG